MPDMADDSLDFEGGDYPLEGCFRKAPMPSDPIPTPPLDATCGHLYRLAEDFAEDPRAFAYGFMAGQIEKVHSGACRAAMFRPPEMDYARQHLQAYRLARIYGVRFSSIHTSRGWEIWVCHEGDYPIVLPADEDSPAWHLARAALCGIADPDPVFHTRHRRASHAE